MAEVVGLAASIIQIAGAGAKLSVALYNFTNSAARADQDIKDIADDVELTSNALESVGEVFESEDAKSIVSKKAIQDANNLIKKCQDVFNELSEMVEKRRKVGKDGQKTLSVMGKLAWPMKEQRVELNRRRLESLKNSLVLLLHVLQLAQGQVRGRMEKSVMEEERDKIRELHQRQQDSLKSLQALESRFCNVALDDEETLQGSSIASSVPTLELMANTQAMKLPPLEKHLKSQANTITINLSGADDSDTSDSDATMTDEDDEHISIEELSKAAKHVTKLLKRITVLQKSLGTGQKPHRKRRVHKMYQRFCRKFESGVNLAQAAGPSAYRLTPVSMHARDGPAPPSVVDQPSRYQYSARRGQHQSATQPRFPPQKQLQGEAYESYSESETGSSDEEDDYEPDLRSPISEGITNQQLGPPQPGMMGPGGQQMVELVGQSPQRRPRRNDRSYNSDRYGYYDDRDRRISRYSSRSRSRSRGGRKSEKWEQAAKAAIVAGAVEAFRSRKEAGPWTGAKGQRVATAALGAAGIDGLIDRSPGLGGLVASRRANGSRSRSRAPRSLDDSMSRSRSRARSRSRSRSIFGRPRSRSSDEGNEHRRKNRAAQVGVAAAAVAGLAARSRSKSRKRKGKRSPSRVRQGVPIAAAGVAGAAVAGLYEKRKAKKEARAASRSKKTRLESNADTSSTPDSADEYKTRFVCVRRRWPSPRLTASDDDLIGNEREETPDLFRNSTLSMFEAHESESDEDSEDEECDDRVYDASLEQGEKEQPIEIGEALDSGDRDIVDVLLEQWTVPVY